MTERPPADGAAGVSALSALSAALAHSCRWARSVIVPRSKLSKCDMPTKPPPGSGISLIGFLPCWVLALLIAIPSYCQESPKIVPIDRKILDSYAGRYQASPDTMVSVRRERDHLILEVNLGAPMEFFPEATDRFFHKASPTKISFAKDKQGNVADLILHRDGEHRAPRISSNPSSDGVETITVDGIDYRRLISGKGKVTVVLGSGLAHWTKVRTGIEPVARVISYEIVERDSALGKRVRMTAPEQARALHAFLEAIHAAPPYILVGHSFAGAQVRIYADLFPESVAGLVLVDPFDEGFADWLKINQPANSELLKQEFIEKYVSDWDGLIGSLRKAQPPARMPVVLLTAGQRAIRKNDALEQKIKPEDFAEAARAIVNAHQEWISKMPKGKHIIVPDAGHEIPTDRPAFVVDAIKEAVKQVEALKP